jgi:hypothetical protein
LCIHSFPPHPEAISFLTGIGRGFDWSEVVSAVGMMIIRNKWHLDESVKRSEESSNRIM